MKEDININTILVDKVRRKITAYGGYLEVADTDIEDLQIYDGGFDGEGEAHGVVSMDRNGVEMDDGDFYKYEELSIEDLKMIIEYIDWKLNV